MRVPTAIRAPGWWGGCSLNQAPYHRPGTGRTISNQGRWYERIVGRCAARPGRGLHSQIPCATLPAGRSPRMQHAVPARADREIRASVCPHDCPSTCALEVEVLGNARIGAVRGAADNSYTAGVICAKVARYAERIHHPDRLTHPLLRTGPKGSGQFRQITWDEALDRTAGAFTDIAARHGATAVWPYFYAGTMGLMQRDG